jgi:hypothetical protein
MENDLPASQERAHFLATCADLPGLADHEAFFVTLRAAADEARSSTAVIRWGLRSLRAASMPFVVEAEQVAFTRLVVGEMRRLPWIARALRDDDLKAACDG